MRSLFESGRKIVVSLQPVVRRGDLQFIKKSRRLFLYFVGDETDIGQLWNPDRVICYLDCFFLLLPEQYNQQQVLWKDFYHCFGIDYEMLIDKGHNLKCMNKLLDYIVEKMPQNVRNVQILDYGCGSGLSVLCRRGMTITGFDKVSQMSTQAEDRGMHVLHDREIQCVPDEFFDAVFSSYVFHMGITQEDIAKIIPKMKKGAIWVANYYKDINVNIVNKMFLKKQFCVKKILSDDERFGSIYEYKQSG